MVASVQEEYNRPVVPKLWVATHWWVADGISVGREKIIELQFVLRCLCINYQRQSSVIHDCIITRLSELHEEVDMLLEGESHYAENLRHENFVLRLS